MIPREIVRSEFIDPMNPIPVPVFDKNLNENEQRERLTKFLKNLILK